MSNGEQPRVLDLRQWLSLYCQHSVVAMNQIPKPYQLEASVFITNSFDFDLMTLSSDNRTLAVIAAPLQDGKLQFPRSLFFYDLSDQRTSARPFEDWSFGNIKFRVPINNSVGAVYADMIYTPDQKYIFFIGGVENDIPLHMVDVTNLPTSAIVNQFTIATPIAAFTRLVCSPDSRHLYVISDQGIVVVDIAQRKVVTVIYPETSDLAFDDLCIDPLDPRRGYATWWSNAESSVISIDLVRNVVTGVIATSTTISYSLLCIPPAQRILYVASTAHPSPPSRAPTVSNVIIMINLECRKPSLLPSTIVIPGTGNTAIPTLVGMTPTADSERIICVGDAAGGHGTISFTISTGFRSHCETMVSTPIVRTVTPGYVGVSFSSLLTTDLAPCAKLCTSIDVCDPLRYLLDGSQSYSPVGRITRYCWTIVKLDSSSTLSECVLVQTPVCQFQTKAACTNYTFSEPGRYEIGLRVVNSAGTSTPETSIWINRQWSRLGNPCAECSIVVTVSSTFVPRSCVDTSINNNALALVAATAIASAPRSAMIFKNRRRSGIANLNGQSRRVLKLHEWLVLYCTTPGYLGINQLPPPYDCAAVTSIVRNDRLLLRMILSSDNRTMVVITHVEGNTVVRPDTLAFYDVSTERVSSQPFTDFSPGNIKFEIPINNSVPNLFYGDMIYTPDQKYIVFAYTPEVPPPDPIMIVDVTCLPSSAVRKQFTVLIDPQYGAIEHLYCSADSRSLYAVALLAILVVDIATRTVVATILPPSEDSSSAVFVCMWIDPLCPRNAYAISRAGGASSVLLLDLVRNKIVRVVTTSLVYQYNFLCIPPHQRILYVATASNSIFMIDLAVPKASLLPTVIILPSSLAQAHFSWVCMTPTADSKRIVCIVSSGGTTASFTLSTGFGSDCDGNGRLYSTPILRTITPGIDLPAVSGCVSTDLAPCAKLCVRMVDTPTSLRYILDASQSSTPVGRIARYHWTIYKVMSSAVGLPLAAAECITTRTELCTFQTRCAVTSYEFAERGRYEICLRVVNSAGTSTPETSLWLSRQWSRLGSASAECIASIGDDSCAAVVAEPNVLLPASRSNRRLAFPSAAGAAILLILVALFVVYVVVHVVAR